MIRRLLILAFVLINLITTCTTGVDTSEEGGGDPGTLSSDSHMEGGEDSGLLTPIVDIEEDAKEGEGKEESNEESDKESNDEREEREEEEKKEKEEGNDRGEGDETMLKISFAGDCTLGTDTRFGYFNSFPEEFDKQNKDYGYFFRGVQSVFASDDLTLVNLETTFTESTVRAEKKFCFKGDPSYVNILKQGSIEMVNISNNHIYDYLQQGYDDTLKALEDGGILYCGMGHIAYHTVGDVTIASLGYTGWSTSIKRTIESDIKKARETADIVIVSFHWGQERVYYPNSVQLELGRYCIDKGADVVVGHHPHVIQGIEYYNGRYIVYSLGNFCFGGNRNPEDKDTFIFQLTFTVDQHGNVVKQDGEILPCRISSVKNRNDYQPNLLEGDEAEAVLDRIYLYSDKLKYGIGKQ